MKLGSLLAGIALRHADREAVICEDRRISFRELNTIANRLGNALIKRGFKVGDRIALYLSNSGELVEAMVGVAKSGAIMVPISTRLTTAEVKFIFEDSQPAAIFFTPEFRAAARTAAANLEKPLMIAVDGKAEAGEVAMADLAAEGAASETPYLQVDPDDCLIAYTSGTTGRPKGAIATHFSVCLLHGFMNATEFGMTDRDVVMVTTPMAHRTGLGRVVNMIMTGGKLVVMKRFDPRLAVDLIEREKVTVLGGVPTIVRMLMPEIERRPQALKTLRLIAATGEVFPVEVKQRLAKSVPHVGVYSFYAQTEGGFIAGLRPEEQRDRPHSMGRAVPGIEIRVVDANLNDVPDGTTGEFLVRCGLPGPSTIMRAYYNRPDATAETIVQGGWLRTGDVGYRDTAGYLYFVDRAKDMVVSGGLNIYSKEVELALAEHPAVVEAAVIGIPDPDFGEAVMAYVEVKGGRRVSSQELIDHCRERIASYKKPKHVRLLDALPRTGTGKVMKGELRKMAAAERAPAKV